MQVQVTDQQLEQQTSAPPRHRVVVRARRDLDDELPITQLSQLLEPSVDLQGYGRQLQIGEVAREVISGDGEAGQVHELSLHALPAGRQGPWSCVARPCAGVTGSLCRQGALGAHVRYTDVWASLGESPKTCAKRIPLLTPQQVDASTMAATGMGRTTFLHGRPAVHDRRTMLRQGLSEPSGPDGAEMSDEAVSSPASIVVDGAESRIHTSKPVVVIVPGG